MEPWWADIRAAVAARRPVDARERESLQSFISEFDRLATPFDEHADRVHVTASAIIVGERGVVLHLHKRLDVWLQPGGHIDSGELPWDAALREATEETGLPLSFAGGVPQLVHVDVHPGPRKHRHLDLRYLLDAPPVTPTPPEGESQEVRWFPWRKAIAMAEPGLEGVLRALQPGVPKFREGRGSDAPGCTQVYIRSREFGIPEVPCIHDRSDIRRWMADEVMGRMDAWVADLDSTIVGQLILDDDYLAHLYIDPAWMGRGLGDRFVEIAKEQRPDGLWLWTFEVNVRARRFYERHGFVAVEFTDGSGNEERAPDVRYQWRP